MIRLSQAQFGYDGRPVVGVDELTLAHGRSLGVFGPNGVGKTTLVRGITGLLPAMHGTVSRQGDPRIAYLPQHAAMESHWPMSGFDAAAMAISAQRRFGWIGPARADVIEMMRMLRVADLGNRPFFTLSGGQQQRLLLAAALSVRPQILVLDEPTAGLDVHSRRMLFDVLRDLHGKDLCSVMISHQIEDLIEICHAVAWLHPADEAGSPSRVEILSPDELGKRLTAHRVAS